jgi:hypothetical protein
VNATDTDTSLEILEDIHLSEDPPCEWPGCTAPVAWIGTMNCCGMTYDVCQTHRDKQDKLEEGAMSRGHAVKCKGCGRTWFDPSASITWKRRP